MASESKSFPGLLMKYGQNIRESLISFKFLVVSLLVAGVYILCFDAEFNPSPVAQLGQEDHRSMLTTVPNTSYQDIVNVTKPKQIESNANGNPRCPIYFKEKAESFHIHKGEWIYKTTPKCTTFESDLQTESFGNGADITQPLPDKLKVRASHNQNFMTNAIELLSMAKNKLVTDYYPDKKNEDQICEGNMLYDNHKGIYSVYTHSDECHYKIFTPQQTKQCVANRNIWILHESVGRDIFYFLTDLIDNQTEHGNEESHKLHAIFKDADLNVTLHFDRLSDFVPTRTQFKGLTVFKEQEMMKRIGDKIAKFGFNEIVFGSIMPDIVHWKWYKEEIPAEYYESVKHALLTLCAIFQHHNVYDFKIWIYMGLTPPLGDTDFGYLAYFYPFWSRAFLKGLHDFIDEYPEYEHHVVLMDTVHVSMDHLNNNYSDDVHFGKIAARKFPNISTVVNDMSGHIILNYLCD